MIDCTPRHGTAKVGLADFMVSIWNYCVDSKTNLSRLAFDIYDRNASGTITEADLEGMLVDVWGEKWRVLKNSSFESWVSLCSRLSILGGKVVHFPAIHL